MLKNYTLIAFAVLLVLVTTALLVKAQDAKPTALEPGRFMLVQGTYSMAGGTTENRTSAVFRIDTQTGETWMFIGVYDKAKGYREGWSRTVALATQR